MKKLLCTALCALLAFACIPYAPAIAEGVTLRTTSSFSGADLGAEGYLTLLAQWEVETGNYVQDTSATSDETWKSGVLNDFAAGNEPDVLFFFACTADSKPILRKVVPLREINEAYPQYGFEELDLLREEDGNVYAISVRPFWEGLLINTDLFDRYDLPLPTDAQKLEHAIAVFNENGVIPIALSLSDVPHYIAEVSILACGSVADHQVRPTDPSEIPDSWVRGMELIRHLYELGAFGEDVMSTADNISVASFLAGEAAMLIDGSWRANAILEDRWNSTIVLPFPTYDASADPTAILGGTSMGFYVTRRAWADPQKRDVAVSLLDKLTGPQAKELLGFAFRGNLLASANEMYENAVANGAMSSPFQDQMDPDARAYWLGMIPQIAEGTADPAEVLAETIRMGAFE